MSDHWELLGHEWAVNMLRQHIVQGAVRHAYLFTGAPGLGRRSLALRFAQALNCPQAATPGEPCRTCRTCQQTEAMQFPDLTVVQAGQEGGILKVEQIREVQHNLCLAPYQARYRLALFLRFQEANLNAANALLKTLEEAPPQVVLLLTADNAEQLLPTIVSRCEVMRLRPVPIDVVMSFLQSRGIDEASARLVAHLSAGRPGYALRLLEDPRALENRKERLDDLSNLLSANRRARFAYAEALAKDKETFRNVLILWLAYWRDVMLSVAQAKTPLTNIDRATEVASLATQLNLAKVQRIVRDLELAIGRLERNVNARLLAEVLLMDWPRIGL